MTKLTLNIDTKLHNQLKKLLSERGTDIETFVKLQLRALSIATKILHLEDKIPFGKYTGELLETIIRGDPKYMNWLIANSKNPTQFGTDILELLEKLEQNHE